MGLRNSDLRAAAGKGDAETAEALLEAGADPSQESSAGWSPLLHAVTDERASARMVRALGDHGDLPPMRGALGAGRAPELGAAGEGEAEVAEALLEGGADPRAKEEGEQGKSAAELAREAGQSGLADRIERAARRWLGAEGGVDGASAGAEAEGSEPAPSAEAGEGGGERIAGKSALMWAAERGEAGMARMLLEAGADPNARDERGWSALMWAARGGSEEMAELLARAGARLDEAGERGETALSIAAEAGRWGFGKELLRLGASPDGPGAGEPEAGRVRGRAPGL